MRLNCGRGNLNLFKTFQLFFKSTSNQSAYSFLHQDPAVSLIWCITVLSVCMEILFCFQSFLALKAARSLAFLCIPWVMTAFSLVTLVTYVSGETQKSLADCRRGWAQTAHQATVTPTLNTLELEPEPQERDYIIAEAKSSAMLPWLHLQQRLLAPGRENPSWRSESKRPADTLWRTNKKKDSATKSRQDLIGPTRATITM